MFVNLESHVLNHGGERAYRGFGEWLVITAIRNQHTAVLLDCEIINPEGTLVASRIGGGKGVPVEHGRHSQRDLPHGGQCDVVVHRELAAALGIVEPQALLPQERAVERRLHLVQAEVLGRRPDLAPQRDLLVVAHRALDDDHAVPDLVRRQPAREEQCMN